MGLHESSLGGEAALPGDLEALELSAGGLLRPLPGEYVRQHGLMTPSGSYLHMETCLYEEEAEQGTHALISMGLESQDGERDSLLAVSFGYNNRPTSIQEDGYTLEEAILVAQDLLDNAPRPLDPADRLLIEHLHDWAQRRANGLKLGRIDLLYADIDALGLTRTADVIRKQTHDSQGVIITKNWWLELGEERILQVESNELVDIPAGDERPRWYSALEIKYENREAGIIYLYVKDHSGRTALGVFSDENADELRVAVADWRKEHLEGGEIDLPTTQDVWFLMCKVEEAVMAEAG